MVIIYWGAQRSKADCVLDIASTSPPSSRGFISTSASSTYSAMTDYEVEVVEIRIREGEIHDIIP